MEIKQNIHNKMIGRQEILIELESEKNPSFAEAKLKIAEEFKKPEENIDVLKVEGKFGKNVFLINANIYDSKSGLESSVEMRKTQKQRVAEKKAIEDAKKAEAEAKKTV
jgi:ribosomal protein S24E